MMPILFTVLFYNFASGLVIYWLVNTILSIGQQYYIHRGPTAAVVAPDAAVPEGVPESESASVTALPAFEATETVNETGRAPQSSSTGRSKSRGGRRRKKK